MLRPLSLAGVILLAAASALACDAVPRVVVFGNPSVECGPFEGADCNDLL